MCSRFPCPKDEAKLRLRDKIEVYGAVPRANIRPIHLMIFRSSSCRECLPVAAPLAIGPPGFTCLGNRLPAGKDNFWREQRTPFTSGGVLILRAADEFVAAIDVADKAGGAEPRNDCVPHGPKMEVNCPSPD